MTSTRLQVEYNYGAGFWESPHRFPGSFFLAKVLRTDLTTNVRFRQYLDQTTVSKYESPSLGHSLLRLTPHFREVFRCAPPYIINFFLDVIRQRLVGYCPVYRVFGCSLSLVRTSKLVVNWIATVQESSPRPFYNLIDRSSDQYGQVIKMFEEKS